MTNVYNFSEQLRLGAEGEEELDAYFGKLGVIVQPVTDLVEQKKGIDRIFHTVVSSLTVEYKTDYLAGRTGNAFLEMIVNRKTGWVFTTQADYICYYVPQRKIIYFVKPDVIRQHINSWLNKLAWRTVKNTTYEAHGMLLPLETLEKISSKVYML